MAKNDYRMKVGIIGAGQIAQIHGRLILRQTDTEIVGVADYDKVRAQVLATDLGAQSYYQDAEEMIEERKPNLVHVLVPPQYHAQLSIMAMNHGCHVLVEKPMALTLADARLMAQTAREKGVYLCVDHSMVFEQVVQRALATVATGKLGEVVSVEAHFAYDPNRHPAILEAGAEGSHWFYQLKGGPLLDFMAHPASLLTEFLPDVQEIQSVGWNRGMVPPGWQDELKVLVKSNRVTGYVYQTTVEATKTLIRAALDNEADRLVHFSTPVVYELLSTKKNAPITEDSPYQKHPKEMGPYVDTKIESEKLVFGACHDDGLKATILRPGLVIGPLGRVFFPHLGYKYQGKWFFPIGKGDNILPLIYVDNLVDGICKAAVAEEAVGQAYNFVDDGEVTVKEYLEKFAEVTGVDVHIMPLPYLIPYLATTGYEMASSLNLVKKGVTSRAQLKYKSKKVYYDTTKAKEELGWRPVVPVEEGMIRTFQWFAKQYLRG
jgi:nucleoside-diphosphate-sugar epimerase